jgi:hypothetical protein
VYTLHWVLKTHLNLYRDLLISHSITILKLFKLYEETINFYIIVAIMLKAPLSFKSLSIYNKLIKNLLAFNNWTIERKAMENE